MPKKPNEKRGPKFRPNESLRKLNPNPATDFLWKIIDDFFDGNIAACARKMDLSRQYLVDILSNYTLIPPSIFLRIQKYLETKNVYLSSNKHLDIINFGRTPQK